VSVMFLPNASNIAGLAPIIKSIRDEASFTGTDIKLHVTPTNVPDLDDEKDILAKLMDKASVELNKKQEFRTVIHHYQSLDILETGPFSIGRPNSKLAKEYESLRLQIIGQNFEDREGALYTLSAIPNELNKARAEDDTFRLETLNRHTRNILLLHPNDGVIAFTAAQAFEALGDQPYELEALNGAIEQGYEVNRARLVRGVKQLVTNNDTESSEEDLLAILNSESATAFELIPALQFLRDISKDWENAARVAIDRPDEQYRTILSVVSYLMAWEDVLPHCANRLLTLTEFTGLTEQSRRRTHNYASLCLIASGNFSRALAYIDKSIELDGGKPKAQHLFNRAMATWGINQAPPEDLLQEFLACSEMLAPDNSVNTRQCLALSHGALGHRDEATKQLHLAEQLLTPGDTSFSCWSYLNSSSEELTEHFKEMLDALDSEKPLVPRFISRTAEVDYPLH